ncbi:1-deoxy-D-xylulose-5-phosphate synthase [Kitasatospora sp. MMS16-BH015]|uniref:1-deoxy-D-xylulose-5-phosphate synthase n=1 Tax=Kitasatospora sp. MMS16-BH015 TaxID=2018025 RepID=UPI000CA28005|nr:1-deoxy-D-xylulose-5-phosphate synthase [Kitasatospora sp. MMS16-BH015]AUG81588.1 1-deoxy-D-xylulose-5-phosphate synthase [Kitasatospora sp. MMS16-BH015]
MTSNDLLSRITGPADVRKVPADQVGALAAEIRRLLITRVTAVGGHLGASLGVVELTIALHRVFDSPKDVILFDTGHQSYAHKALTGRAEEFTTLRQRGGLSGYPSRSESAHDWIENSHASTSIGYADGLCKAFARSGQRDRHVVAVIGDGALGGGVALEALNGLAANEHPAVVVLNDNGRSYDPSVGGLAAHLAELRTGRADRAASLFAAFGLAYTGPVDGHDVRALEAVLTEAARAPRSTLVHVVTAKGHGYPPAEADEADRMHACGVVSSETGRALKPSAPSWTDVFAKAMVAQGERRPALVAVTAAMRLPVGLGPFTERYPGRVFDAGIAEQYALTMAAGLATAGLQPVVALYATFLNRAFDQLLLDVALHRLPVVFALDRAGVTGPDGASHHGLWDLALLARIPGLRVAAPRDPARLEELLDEALERQLGPSAIRFPRSTAGRDLPQISSMSGMDILWRTPHGRLEVLLVAVGQTAGLCLEAADLLGEREVGVTVVDPRWVLPVNPALVHLAARHRVVVVVEDGVRSGAVGSAVAEAVEEEGVPTPVHRVGLPTAFLEHGSREELLSRAGLDGARLAARTRGWLAAARADRRELRRSSRQSAAWS